MKTIKTRTASVKRHSDGRFAPVAATLSSKLMVQVRRIPQQYRVMGVIALVVIVGSITIAWSRAASGITVSGNQLLKGGSAWTPRGFTMVGMLTPPGCSNGTGIKARDHYNQTELNAAKAWKADTLRFQISYNGLTSYTQTQRDQYMQQIISGVQLARSSGFAVILSLQDQPVGCGPGRPLPPQAAVGVWQKLATQFKTDSFVMFELWNEPQNEAAAARKSTGDGSYNSYLAWPDWKSGRTTNIVPAPGANYNNWTAYAPTGHQQLVNAIRGTGATNVLIADGARLGEHLEGVPILTDTLANNSVIYAGHSYYFQTSQADWENRWGYLTATHPVIITEWNYTCGNTAQSKMAQQHLDWLKSKKIGLTAWGFDFMNTLISDWNYTPTSDGNCTTHAGGLITKNYFASFPVQTGPDTTAPTAKMTSPAAGATVAGTVTVGSTTSDNVAVTSVTLRVDGAWVASDQASPFNFQWDSTTVPDGQHTLEIRAWDAANNMGTSGIITVTVANKSGPVTQPPMTTDYKVFYGTTHAHTGYFNDHGQDNSTFRDGFVTAKKNGFDWLIETEHSGPTGPISKGVNPDQFYIDSQQAAAELSDSTFVGMVGYEYSENGGDGDSDAGHLTGYNTDKFVSAATSGMNFDAFMDYLVTQSASKFVFGGFNHPGAAGHPASVTSNLNAARRNVIMTSEVQNSDVSKGSDPNNYQGFVVELDRGWRVAPTCGMDNHGLANYSKPEPGPCRTGVLASSLTKTNIEQAFKARRIFASRDTNLVLKYKANNSWMGSPIGKPSTVSFDITVSDPNTAVAGDKITKVQVIGSGGAVLATQSFSAYSVNWKPSIPAGSNKYMFVRVYNGERTYQTAVGAPVWLE